jgi:mRNA guanylyltransferase
MQRLSVNRDDPLYRYAINFMESAWGTVGKNIFPGSQPVSIEYRHFNILKSNQYVVCEKTDGVRFMMLVFLYNNKKQCVFINRALDMYTCPLNFKTDVYKGSILEGEMYGDVFMIYDILLSCGETVSNCDFLTRLKSIEKIKKMLTCLKYDPIKLKIKTFHIMNEYRQFLEEYLPTVTETIDGLIFTPVNDTVKKGTHETMFKWKPRDKNTIDFQVKRGTDAWRLYVQEKGKLIYESEIPYVMVPENARTWIEENAIIECQYMFNDTPMWWKPVNRRYDKTFPNSRRTFYRTLVNIKEDISITDFLECMS